VEVGGDHQHARRTPGSARAPGRDGIRPRRRARRP
jgi:hypothetical protein